MNLVAILIPAIITLAIIAFFKMRIKQQKQMRSEMNVSRHDANMEYLRSIGYSK